MKNITGTPLKSESIEAEACMDCTTRTEMKEGGWYEVWQVKLSAHWVSIAQAGSFQMIISLEVM